ncbi:MAG: hypothetical protein ACRCX2_32240 [Paraclostridium sp.]
MIFYVNDAPNIPHKLATSLGVQNPSWADFDIEEFDPGVSPIAIESYRLYLTKFTSTMGIASLSEDRIVQLYQRYQDNLQLNRQCYGQNAIVDIIHKYAQPVEEGFIFRPVEFTKTIGSLTHYKMLLKETYPLLDITDVDIITMYNRVRGEFEVYGVSSAITHMLTNYTVVDYGHLCAYLASIGLNKNMITSTSTESEIHYAVKFVATAIIKMTSYHLDLAVNIAKKYLGRMENTTTSYKINQVYPRNKKSTNYELPGTTAAIDGKLLQLIRE